MTKTGSLLVSVSWRWDSIVSNISLSLCHHLLSLSRILPPFTPSLLPPLFFIFSAAVARHLYVRPNSGIGGLAKAFGARKNNGSRPSHKSDASTSILRKSLQALEKLNLVEKAENGGRRISSAGRRDLDRVAGLLAKTN